MKFWIPAFSGMACLGLGAGLISIYGFFVEPLSREFGVGVATLNMGPLALLLVPGIVAPRIGKLADRLPIRRIVLVGVTVAMLALVAVSMAPTLWLAALGFLVFAFGLTLYGPVVINGLMVKVYPGHEARALALVAMGISIATTVLPPIVGAALAVLDWRQALFVLALVLLAILWFAAGAGIPSAAGGVVSEGRSRVDEGITGRREFWLIGICVALGFNVAIILAICYPPLFVSEGYSVSQAGWFISAAGIAGLSGKAVIAWLADAGRNHVRWMAAGLLLLQALGLLLLLASQGAADVLVALALLGFGGGGFLPMHPYLNSRYFDPSVIGQVNGAQMPLFLPLGLLGPPLAGYAFDQTGNYSSVLVCLVVVLLLAAGIAMLLPAAKN